MAQGRIDELEGEAAALRAAAAAAADQVRSEDESTGEKTNRRVKRRIDGRTGRAAAAREDPEAAEEKKT